MENCPFIVDIPIKNGDFPSLWDSLPEGTQKNEPKKLNSIDEGPQAKPLKVIDLNFQRQKLLFVQHMEMTRKHYFLPGLNRLREFWYVQQLQAATILNQDLTWCIFPILPIPIRVYFSPCQTLGFTEIKH